MADTPQRGIVSPSSPAPLDVPVAPRNPGMPLELDWIEEVRVNRSAVERRAATLRTRRTVKKEWQAAWLLRAITCMDLTTLVGRRHAGPGAPAVRQGAPAGARRPPGGDGREPAPHPGRARCASTTHSSPPRVEALEGSGIPVAAVSTGFPAGLSPFEQRIAEIRASVAAGARGDRHRHHPRARAHRRTGARSTTRCAPSARPAATPT